MTEFQDKLKKLIDEYVHFVYHITSDFPKEETYSSKSQWRRSTLSIMLNYIEGYARRKPTTVLYFYEIAYGSLQESKYLLDFSYKQNLITKLKLQEGSKLAEEIGAMLWSEIKKLEASISKM